MRTAELRLQALSSGIEPGNADEVQRRRSERLFSAAFDESPEALSLTRLWDGMFVDVNQEWLRLTGFTREDVLGHTGLEIGHWRDPQDRQAALAPLLTQGRLRNFEGTLLYTKDGSPRLLRLDGSLIDVFGDKHVLMHVRDITAERMAEVAMQAGERALEQANARLREQLELYELTENMALVGHWTALADGKEILWSKGLHSLAGTAPGGTISSAQARSGIHEDDLPMFVAARQKMDGATHEFRFRRFDGGILWLRSRMHRQHSGDGAVTDFGIVQDITAEREARLQLEEKLDFIQKITSRMPDMVFQYQSRVDGRSWLAFASDAIRTLFRLEPEDVRQDVSRLLAVIHPEDLAAFKQSLRDTAYEGASWHHEFRVKFDDGGVRWLLGHASTHREAEGGLVSYGAVTDITERKQTEARLQDSEERFRSLTELSSDWYWETDEQARFTRFDGHRTTTSPLPQLDIMGKTRRELGALNLSANDWQLHHEVLAGHQKYSDFEIQRLDGKGQTYWVSISGMPMFDAQGKFRGYRGIGRDITARKLAEDETQRLAFYDTLTGLPNRRLLMDRLNQALAMSVRSQHFGALLFIDLDNFKDLNDTLGHDVGDLLLQQVAQRLVSCIREGDTAARFGGDEYVVMLENLSDNTHEAVTQVELVAEKILRRLNRNYDLQGRQHSSTPSIGIALFCGHEQNADELLKRADVAMYQAKAAGRNTLRFFDPAMQATVVARAALDADLRRCVQRDELLLYYQPVVDGERNITGYEALLRWQHPVRGLVTPGEFIELAEQTGLILPIGQWVLQTACRQLVVWAAQPATRELTMSVNVSARQFRHPDFVAQVLAVLEASGADAQRLKFELTESMLLGDVEDAIRKMSELRAHGVRFSLDDFGTGYSSLSYLKRLPLDQLKIDQSFVRDVLTDPNDAAIVRTILALARSMDLVAVAEGVETEGQHQFLLNNGCWVFQGYLFGRPGPLPGPTGV